MTTLKSITIFFLFAILLLACSTHTTTKLIHTGTTKHLQKDQTPFYHGVASGDPLADRVIIWTRVSPEKEGDIKVKWIMSEDRTFHNKVHVEGELIAYAKNDYTVKVDVSNLKPNTTYYYQFEALSKHSVIGKTQTAPIHSENIKLAIVSCNNYEGGFFNAFRHIAKDDDVDVVLHLGDYIYEYAPKVYGDSTTGRFHLPAKELVSLEDYRTRYAQYRLDQDLQNLHQAKPFITIWDDHEIADNSYSKGSKNHKWLKDGSYKKRKSAAAQAYFEWMPIREQSNQKLYRKISFGVMLDILMLDERLAGRTAPAKSVTDTDYNSDERSMLGTKQLHWLKNELKNSKAKWKLLGNQVIFSEFKIDKRLSYFAKNLDAWDGYPNERKQIIEFLDNNKIENTIIVTGDTHSSWAFEVCKTPKDYIENNGAAVAVEFGTPSITSGNTADYVPLDSIIPMEKRLYVPTQSPHLKYVNLSDKGYLLLSISEEEANAEWIYTDKVNEASGGIILGPSFQVKSGTNQLLKTRDFKHQF